MSLTDEHFEEFLDSVLALSVDTRLYVPFETPGVADEVTFQGFGISIPSDSFRLGWIVRTQPASSAVNLLAFCNGAVRYESGPPSRLILRNGDVLGRVVRNLGRLRSTDALPFWFPLPNYIIYENIDGVETERIIGEYLESNATVVAQLNAHLDGPAEAVSDWVRRFMINDLPIDIPVHAGERIGSAGNAPDNATVRQVALFMQEQLDNSEGLFLDPAVYHHHWQSFFQNLSNHPFENRLKQIFAGPVANGVVRFVGESGVGSGDFTEHRSPARLPSLAVAAADPFDTIVVIDNGYYDEPDELVIDKPLNLTSLSDVDVLEMAVDANELPVISGEESHRVIDVHETTSMVSITNVAISDGAFTPFEQNEEGRFPAQGGGGIVLQRTRQFYMRNCLIRGNRTIEGERSNAENGFGGGLLSYYAEAYLYHNYICENQSDERGGGIAIFGYGWPTLEDNLIDGNRAEGLPNRSDGGGIAVEIAVPSRFSSSQLPETEAEMAELWDPEELRRARRRRIGFYRNTITNNRALDDAGGVYMTVMSRAEFRANEINHNRSNENGGGLRISYGSSALLQGDSIHHNHSNAGLSLETRSGGGGIAATNADLTLRDVRIENNIAHGWAGGGISFISTESTQEEHDSLISYETILRSSSIFGATQFALDVGGAYSIAGNASTWLTGQDGDHRKGGGAYLLRYQEENYVALPLIVRIVGILSRPLLADNNLEAEGGGSAPANADLADMAGLYLDDWVDSRTLHLGNLESFPGFRESEDLLVYPAN